MTGPFNEQSRITAKASNRRNTKYVKVILTSAQLLALNTTPITVVPAPGAGLTNVIQNIYATCPAQTTGYTCLLYTSPSPRDRTRSRMPSSA